MRYLANVLLSAIVLAASTEAAAQGTTYKLGTPLGQEEIRLRDIDVSPDGKGLPPGSGTAEQGGKIWVQKCARCHGQTGEQQYMGFTAPAGGSGLVTKRPSAAFATIRWDFINRAMPRGEEGSLSANEVYALTAVLLYWDGVIGPSDVMNAQSLPKVQMPNRNGFVPLRPDYKQYVACGANLLRCVDYWREVAEKEK